MRDHLIGIGLDAIAYLCLVLAIVVGLLFSRWRRFKLMSFVIPARLGLLEFAGNYLPHRLPPFRRASAKLGVLTSRVKVEDPSSRWYVHEPEVEALMRLGNSLREFPVQVFLNKDHRGFANQLFIGGTFYTEGVQELFEVHLKPRGIELLPKEQEGGCETFRVKKTLLRCGHEDKQVKKDVGIVARFKAGGKDALLCSGMHSPGTKAAVYLALDPEFQKKVGRAALREFVQCFEVSADDPERPVWEKYSLTDLSLVRPTWSNRFLRR